MRRSGPSFRSRHPARFVVLVAMAAVVAAGAGVFGWRWTHSGAHELSSDEALRRFGARPAAGAAVTGIPAQGVYRYVGSGTERVSRPPKSQLEGPGIPGTVTWLPGGCWSLRLDYSDNHWQSTTYCRQDRNLVSTARAGWYRWDFVVVVVDDTASYQCRPPSVAVPAKATAGDRYPLSCTGGNVKIKTGPVTMVGYTEVLGTGTVSVGGRGVAAVHTREELTLSGGQTGTNHADTWFDATNGLPLRGTWSTDVTSPSPIGNVEMTAGGEWTLASLTPRS